MISYYFRAFASNHSRRLIRAPKAIRNPDRSRAENYGSALAEGLGDRPNRVGLIASQAPACLQLGIDHGTNPGKEGLRQTHQGWTSARLRAIDCARAGIAF